MGSFDCSSGIIRGPLNGLFASNCCFPQAVMGEISLPVVTRTGASQTPERSCGSTGWASAALPCDPDWAGICADRTGETAIMETNKALSLIRRCRITKLLGLETSFVRYLRSQF